MSLRKFYSSATTVTTAKVERSFSDMKLIKTRLRSRLGEEAPESYNAN